MAVKQLARILVLLNSVVFALSLFKRDGETAYSSEDQEAFVNAHNDYRSNVQPTASNMIEMKWDAVLAKQAQVWADKCLFEHPKKTVYEDYVGIGQNLYTTYSWSSVPSQPEVNAVVTSWYSEDKYYNYYTNVCTPPPRKSCGHYTQVVWADTTAVGCGIKFCLSATAGSNTLLNAWIVVCNYKPGGNLQLYDKSGKIVALPPYETGEQCSTCEDGKPCKNGLCSDCTPNGADCECKIKCKNCGTPVSGEKCECSCPDGYYGPVCEEYCEDKDDYCGANPGWPEKWCEDEARPYVAEKCPVMCKLCTPGPRVDQNNC